MFNRRCEWFSRRADPSNEPAQACASRQSINRYCMVAIFQCDVDSCAITGGPNAVGQIPDRNRGDQSWSGAALIDHHLVGATDRDVGEFTVAHGADVNAKDDKGTTPLHWAESKGHQDVAALLREHGGH
jgi:ankyrin repeat protein